MSRSMNRRLTLAMVVSLTAASACSDSGDSPDGNADPMAGMDMSVPDADGMEGMDMGGSASDGSVRLSARDMATFGITFGTVAVRPHTTEVRSVGVVDFDETRMVYVAPKFGGWVEDLRVDFTGQVVRRGQPLFDVYSPELVAAQEELLLASRMARSLESSRVEGAAGSASDLAASARRRLAYWDISSEQIDRLLETRQVRRTLTVYAPASGIVMEKNVAEGQAFTPGANLYMIADLSRVWVNAEVFERDIWAVRQGMLAQISVAAVPERAFEGRVEYVYPTLAEGTRSMRARITIANPGSVLKPGMYATVRLTVDLGPTLTIPGSAVLYSGERAVAFVDMGDGRLMPHELELGTRGREWIQVVSGVAERQRVVTSAQFFLDSESNLAEVMRAMMAQMNLSEASGMDMGGMDMEGMDESPSDGMDSMDGMDMSGTPTPPDTMGSR